MGIANLREFALLKRQAAALEANMYTIACVSCKTPLWQFEILGWHGGNKKGIPIKRMISREGVDRYDEYWDKKTGQPLKHDCPFCGETYFQTVQPQDQNGKPIIGRNLICVPYCPELE